MVDEQRIARVKRKYSINAPWYDVVVTPPTLLVRRRAIRRLQVEPGQVVLDFGCGTGLSFPYVQSAIGPAGRIIGVELSPAMADKARARVKRNGWSNVTLIEGNAEEVEIPGPVDRVLCFYTHDIMNSRAAVERAVHALRPGGRYVAAGIKRRAGILGIPLNLYTLLYSLPFVTIKAVATLLWGTAIPWANLQSIMGPLEIEDAIAGTAYIAVGVKRAGAGDGEPAA
jgi:ubiquinone/menaquinone biosynthesis C-methylase UbiE